MIPLIKTAWRRREGRRKNPLLITLTRGGGGEKRGERESATGQDLNWEIMRERGRSGVEGGSRETIDSTGEALARIISFRRS